MPRPQRYAAFCFALLVLSALVVVWRHSGPLQAPAVQQEQFSLALRQARQGEAGAARVLYQQLARPDLTPGQRVALYAVLPDYPSPRALKLARADLHHESPQVRAAAIDAVVGLVPANQVSLILGPLLEDPESSLRYAAAAALLDLSADDLGLYVGALDQVLDQWRTVLASQTGLAAQRMLARVLLYQGALAEAAALLEHADRQAPSDPQLVELQMRLLDRQGHLDQARQWLADKLRQYPQSAALQEVLGLWLLAHQQEEYAVLALTRAVELEPDSREYRYQLAATLHAVDQVDAAQRQLQDLVQRHPQDRRARALLIGYWKETGQLQNVQVLLAQLEQQNPDDPLVLQGL